MCTQQFYLGIKFCRPSWMCSSVNLHGSHDVPHRLLQQILLLLALLLLAGCGTSSPAPVSEAKGEWLGNIRKSSEDVYVVQKGDTLVAIAFEHGLDYRDVALWNGLANPDTIYPGDEIVLVAPKTIPKTRALTDISPTPSLQPLQPVQPLQPLRPLPPTEPADAAGQEPTITAIGSEGQNLQSGQGSGSSFGNALGNARAVVGDAQGVVSGAGNIVDSARAVGQSSSNNVGGVEKSGNVGSVTNRPQVVQGASDNVGSGIGRASGEVIGRAADAAGQAAASGIASNIAGQAAAASAVAAIAKPIVQGVQGALSSSSQPTTAPTNAPTKSGPEVGVYPYSDAKLRELQQQQRQAVQKPINPVISVAKVVAPAPPKNMRKRAGVEWSWPSHGTVTRKYNTVSKGVDFAGRRGDSVYAVADGKVVYVGTGVKSYGRLVIIKHDNDYLSAYAHNEDIRVQEGEQVQRGDFISTFGDSSADQVMLHLEIRKGGKPINPMEVLPSQP